MGWSSLPYLRFMKQPALILQGTQDPLIPSINIKIMASIIPDCQLECFDCSHMFMLTRAEQVAPVVRNFVQVH